MEGFIVPLFALSRRSLFFLFFLALISLAGVFAATHFTSARQSDGPQAKPDSYCASPGNELKAPAARGVLVNDTGSPLTIVANTNPANGTLKLNGNVSVTGVGVTFYLTNGATVQFNGNAHLNLSAPTSGTYSGILFFGDRTQANATQKFNGDATSSMTGALYFPTQQVQMTGNFSGVNGCMQVVADTIDYTGSSTLAANCAAQGMRGVNIPGAVSLVE